MYKLLNLGIGGKFYELLKNMYTNNVSTVKFNGMQTDYFECQRSVRHGDGLSPTLFNVFVNDLHTLFNTEDCDLAKYGHIKIGCILYADDLVIILESYLGMQKCLNKLENYCKKWKIYINVSKNK